MTDLSAVTAQDFEPLAGAAFAVGSVGLADAPGASLSLALVEVERRPGGTSDREPFSLMFEGPRSAFLPQGMRRLVHEGLGEMDLFLVPVGETDTAYRYEAVFA